MIPVLAVFQVVTHIQEVKGPIYELEITWESPGKKESTPLKHFECFFFFLLPQLHKLENTNGIKRTSLEVFCNEREATVHATTIPVKENSSHLNSLSMLLLQR